MEGPYCQRTEKIWRDITNDGLLRLAFHDDMSPMDIPSLTKHMEGHKHAKFIWNAKIIDKADAEFIPELKDYALTNYDLVLLVQRLH